MTSTGIFRPTPSNGLSFRFRKTEKPRRRPQQARAQLAMMLGGCSDQALAGFTAEKLASTHRVGMKECEYELMMARQRRGRV